MKDGFSVRRIAVGIVAAAAMAAAALPSLAAVCGKTMCEGMYKGHLQGVATDGESLYWTFTVKLVKTDMSGKVIAARDVPTHHGDLCCVGGKVYVAVNRGKFNQLNAAVSEVRAYDCATLEPAGVWPLPDMPHGAGGMTCRDGRFYVVGGLPSTHEQNHVYEYSADFKLLKRHDLDTGFTLMGIQTAEWDAAANRFLFGIYGCKGNPPGVIVTDAGLSAPVRHTGPGNVGLLHIKGRLFAGGTGHQEGECSGWIAPMADDALSEATRYVPPKSDGSACVRFFFEGRKGADWEDAGYVFCSSGYKQLSRYNAAFVRKGDSPSVWPAVGIGGQRAMSVPDLLRGVRRAAEFGETLSFHLPGNVADMSKDPALSAAVDAIRREAAALNVRVDFPR